jgi:hypothetical protein
MCVKQLKKKIEAFFLSFERYLEIHESFKNVYIYLSYDFLRDTCWEALIQTAVYFIKVKYTV